MAAAYASSGYGDELAMAALFLAQATGSQATYQEAESYWTRYNLGDSLRVFNWDSKNAGLPILFAQVNQASSLGGNFSVWQKRAEDYFDQVISNQGPGRLTDGKMPIKRSQELLTKRLNDNNRWTIVLRR